MWKCAFVLSTALSLIACTESFGTSEPAFSEHETTGTVHVPLGARSASGKNYRLRNATFELTGAAMFTLADRDAKDPDRLMTTLPVGGYSLYLRPGWELVEVGPDGTDVKTAASLASTNPMAFEIGRTLDARLKIALRVGDEEVVFGGVGAMKMTSLGVATPSAL